MRGRLRVKEADLPIVRRWYILSMSSLLLWNYLQFRALLVLEGRSDGDRGHEMSETMKDSQCNHAGVMSKEDCIFCTPAPLSAQGRAALEMSKLRLETMLRGPSVFGLNTPFVPGASNAETRALSNIYLLARREMARRNPRDPEMARAQWGHIVRFCEEAGCRSSVLPATQTPPSTAD